MAWARVKQGLSTWLCGSSSESARHMDEHAPHAKALLQPSAPQHTNADTDRCCAALDTTAEPVRVIAQCNPLVCPESPLKTPENCCHRNSDPQPSSVEGATLQSSAPQDTEDAAAGPGTQAAILSSSSESAQMVQAPEHLKKTGQLRQAEHVTMSAEKCSDPVLEQRPSSTRTVNACQQQGLLPAPEDTSVPQPSLQLPGPQVTTQAPQLQQSKGSYSRAWAVGNAGSASPQQPPRPPRARPRRASCIPLMQELNSSPLSEFSGAQLLTAAGVSHPLLRPRRASDRINTSTHNSATAPAQGSQRPAVSTMFGSSGSLQKQLQQANGMLVNRPKSASAPRGIEQLQTMAKLVYHSKPAFSQSREDLLTYLDSVHGRGTSSTTKADVTSEALMGRR